MLSVTYVYFTLEGKKYEYCFNTFYEALQFSNKIEKKHGVKTEIFEKDVS